MKRTLTILKYLPAALCGLLVVAWVVNEFTELELFAPLQQDKVCLAIDDGSLTARSSKVSAISPVPSLSESDLPFFRDRRRRFVGQLKVFESRRGLLFDTWLISIPIPFLLTLLLPFTIGAFNRFRFPLWSWFAFTGLVAVELAYYLR